MAHDRAAVKEFGDKSARQTRFDRAGAEWDDRIGTSRVQAANWRLAFFSSMLFSLVCVVGLIVQSTKASVIPYLVEVEASGQVRLVGAVTTQDWSLTESSKRESLTRFIRNLRSISSDHNILQERFAYVRNHATPAGQLQIDRMLESHDPFERFGKEQRTIRIISQNALKGSKEAYRVEWEEKVFGEGGGPAQKQHYVGEFHLSIIPPTDEQTLELNPLGVYVSFFDFDRKNKE